MRYSEIIRDAQQVAIKENVNVSHIDHTNRLSYLQCINCRDLYFPDNPTHNEQLFALVKANQFLSLNDLGNYFSLKKNLNLIGEQNINFEPTIFCAFHFGSYRIINCILHEKNIDFSVVANGSVIGALKEKLFKLHEEEVAKSNRTIEFNLINVEENSGVIQMIRALRQGKSLVIYIDGGNGIGGFGRNDEKLIKINFLHQKIYSRSGVAFLSHYLKTPIVPVLSWREDNWEQIFVKFYNPIIPKGDKENYILETTQNLWNLFAEKVNAYPEQWEAMLYAHHFIAIKESISIKQIFSDRIYRYNRIRYAFLKHMDEHYLYDNLNSCIIKVPSRLFKALVTLEERNISLNFNEYSNLFHKEILTDLLERNILEEVN